jgi:asparagine synthase (glutamine-hydrolysing)
VGLAHTRLKILDLSSAGHQPMTNGERNIAVVYNGEVYNYRDLKTELNDTPTAWRSGSDTEVILRGYERRGDDIVPKLRGMFAFAIWDNARRRLLLARDPLGIKPLYYYATGSIFVFASEVRALLASGIVPRKLSSAGLVSYLRVGSVHEPLTMIEGVRSLPAGQTLTIEVGYDGDLEIREASVAHNVWPGNPIGRHEKRADLVAELRGKLEHAVRSHLVSDVPLAAFLSGGIDSSAIVGLMSRVASEKPKTFTVVFDEKEFSERNFARSVAERYGTEHHEVLLSEDRLLALLPRALAAMDQPSMDGVNTYVVAKAVKDSGITVALSGLGSDELFAGYPSFRRAQLISRLKVAPSLLRRVVARAGRATLGSSRRADKLWDLAVSDASPLAAYTVSRRLFADADIAGLLLDQSALLSHAIGASTRNFQVDEDDPVNAVSAFELSGYMRNTLLRDADQMSMAVALETRVPFLDADLVHFVLGIPGEWKLDRSRPKPLLLDAVGDLIPETVWKRPKMGFVLPFSRWMQSTLRKDIEDAVFDNAGFARIGLTRSVSQVWDNFADGSGKETWGRPWALYVLRQWCELNRISL